MRQGIPFPYGKGYLFPILFPYGKGYLFPIPFPYGKGYLFPIPFPYGKGYLFPIPFPSYLLTLIRCIKKISKVLFDTFAQFRQHDIDC